MIKKRLIKEKQASNSKLRVGSLFTGIGAWEKALVNLGVGFDLKFFCELDRYAEESYCGIFGEDKAKNLGDITKVDTSKIGDIDMLFYSPPCQAFSVAGKQGGFEDKRGVLFFDALKIIAAKLPKVCIMENVKGLTGKKFDAEFKEMLRSLEELGYTNSWKVLNAKDYGIPQNRERVFVFSELGGEEFEFPEGEELKLRLADMLEDEVDEKYYVSDERTRKFFENLENKIIVDKIPKGDAYKIIGSTQNPTAPGTNSRCWVHDINHNVSCLSATDYKDPKLIAEPNRSTFRIRKFTPKECFRLNTMQGGWRQPCILRYERTQYGKDIRKKYENGEVKEKIGNMRELKPREDGICNTITTVQKDNMVLVDDAKSSRFSTFRIRKLTPKECFRLQGFSDDDFEKARESLNNTFYKGKDRSSSQLYKQAGNSICVTVPMAMLREYLGLRGV
jgi:DNA (cytosine-5)-methyltransferase 1